MKKKFPIGLVVAGGALLAVSALCVLTGIGSFQWVNKNVPGFDLMAYNRYQGLATEIVTFDPEDAVGIRMDWSYGDITLIQTDDDEILMDMVKVSYGESQWDADQKAEALTVDVSDEKGMKVFSFQQPNEPNALVIEDNPSRIDVLLYVPKDLDVELSNWTGMISSEGFTGNLYVNNQFGSVEISDLVGNLSVESSSGFLDLYRIDAGENSVRFASQYGNITLEDLSAGEVEVESNNGEISITGLISEGPCQVDSGFGPITVQGFICSELTTTSQNGWVELENGELQGDLNVTSDFGNIKLTQVFASNYTMETSNGNVEADQVAGKVKVTSDFGDITLENGDDAVLDITIENGKILYSGSLSSEEDHTVTCSFGNVVLYLAEDTSLDIDLKTDFGTIKSEFPVTLQGQMDPSIMQGKLNDGGALMKIESSNGDIELLVQP
ncbi:DUF4097 domain-containing protein [bacterium]|nr:DUF4097 domain-containing protein [bacterium]MCB2179244.1 DUF4097 domain-containing protein [bacterium]